MDPIFLAENVESAPLPPALLLLSLFYSTHHPVLGEGPERRSDLPPPSPVTAKGLSIEVYLTF